MGRKLAVISAILFPTTFFFDIYIVIVFNEPLWLLKALFDGVVSILCIATINK